MGYNREWNAQSRIGDGTRARLGLRVFDIADPRHVGRIEKFISGVAMLRFEETGWLGEAALGDLYQPVGY